MIQIFGTTKNFDTKKAQMWFKERRIPFQFMDLKEKEMSRGEFESVVESVLHYAAVNDYNNAVLHGIVKIASKMGISTLQSYQGSQIFEAVGISKKVIDEYFTNTVSRVEGITIEDIAEDGLAANIPEGWFQFTPDEKSLIYTLYEEGRKKDPQVYDVKEPDDRQPGWRTRSYLAKYDLASGILQPLTFGYHNVYLNDISADSRYLLIGKSEECLTKRPTTLNSLYRLDLNDMSVEALVEKGEFLNSAQFSPDGKSILVTGSPEAFDGIGKNVEEGQIPSMVDTQLFLMNLADKKVRPMTKNFNPNVQSVDWSKADGNIYFTAEDKDCMHLFQLNPKSGKFTLLKTPEENIKSFSIAAAAPEMAFSGQSASNADRLYKMSTKAQKSLLVDDLSARLLKDIELGECKAWN